MSRGNDAIFSWSGFNYQGKVLLYYVLQKINEITGNGKNIDIFTVEIEKNEDFIIYENLNPISFHQVKATLSKKNLSGYNEALEKLLKHRDDSINPKAECYLMSAIEIKDWDTSTNKFKDKVILYTRSSEYIGLDKVSTFIKELLLLLDDKLDIDTAYLELCDFIDQQVSSIHQKQRSYMLQFKEFIDIIKKSRLNTINKYELKKKEDVYEHITQNILKALEEFCEFYCEDSDDQAKCSNCGASKHYDDLLSINIWNWTKIINPDKYFDSNSLKYIEYLPKEKYTNVIYDIFSLCQTDKMDSSENLSYIEDEFYDSENKKIIPTLLSFSTPRPSKNYISRIMQNINNNSFVYEYINGNVITAFTNNNTYSTSDDKFTNIPQMESLNDKLTNLKSNVLIVDNEELKRNLEDE